MDLEPDEVTLLIAISITPWLFKIFFAICSDSVTLCGTRRKSYLIINSIVNTFAIILLMLLGLKLGKVFIMTCVVIANMALTWLDTLAEALIAQASRYDLKNGAANLHIFMIYCVGFGGLTACIVGGSFELKEYRESLHD